MQKNKLFKSNIVKLVRKFNHIIQKSKNETTIRRKKGSKKLD
jgi:hypothetical protein